MAVVIRGLFGSILTVKTSFLTGWVSGGMTSLSKVGNYTGVQK